MNRETTSRMRVFRVPILQDADLAVPATRAFAAPDPAARREDPPMDSDATRVGRFLRGLRRFAVWGALLIALVTTLLTALASRHTSPTFDEIVLVAGGARGYQTGDFDIAPEHPPLMQYLYGLPVWLSQPDYPATRDAPDWRQGRIRDFTFRYGYAREFYWGVQNDAERITLLGRLMGAVLAGTLVFAAFAMTRRFGALTALVAAGLVSMLPDVLAHGGVAYNDLPLALAYLLAVWALDVAIRRPTPGQGVLAGLAIAFALGIKFSAIVLLPLAGVLLAAQFMTGPHARHWGRNVAMAAVSAVIAMYLGMVLIYRGDFALGELRYGLDFTFGHVSGGHGAPGYLLGETSLTGWWYFFPVAFLFKTPAALHVLLLAGVAGLGLRARGARAGDRADNTQSDGCDAATPHGSGAASDDPGMAAESATAWLDRLRELAGSPLRAPVLGALAFAGALITSSLVIGFRYALPVLPLLCVIVAVGVSRLWTVLQRPLRLTLAGAAVAYAASTLSFYPYFLSYTSEYGPGRDRGDEVLLDSSLDWGQGLIALRDWMRANEVPSVYLSYFGSGWPAGYGIDYVPLPSFFPLPATGPAPEPAPEYAVISATNLHGIYLANQPFAQFLEAQPVAVLAHSLKVYRLNVPAN